MTERDLAAFVRKRLAWAEILVFLAGLALLIRKLAPLLLQAKAIPIHDHLYWGYPPFQFFAESLINGALPFWNPYSHGGESFYPSLMHSLFYDPIVLLTVLVGQFFTHDTVTLYNWTHFNRSLVMVTGMYLFFRPLCRHWLVRLSLVPILLFSSIMFGSFRQPAFVLQFTYVPFVAYFFLRIVHRRDYRWHNWLALAGFLGLCFQSYFFTGVWTLLLAFLIGLAIFRRDLLKALVRRRSNWCKLAAAVAITAATAAPNLALMHEKDRNLYPARMIDPATRTLPSYEAGSASQSSGYLRMPYDIIVRTGARSRLWDYLQLLTPDANRFVKNDSGTSWGDPSEAYMYIGVLPWIIALLGMVVGRHGLKRIWLLVLLFFALLSLGPPALLHKLLYCFYPLLWFVRNIHGFELFFVFAVLYFYVLGLRWIIGRWRRSSLFAHRLDSATANLPPGSFRWREVAAFAVLAPCLLGLLCLSARADLAEKSYAIFLALAAIVIWALRRWGGPRSLFTALVAVQIGIVLAYTPVPREFARNILVLLMLPVLLFEVIRLRVRLHPQFQTAGACAAAGIFLAVLCLDMNRSSRCAKSLYNGHDHPQPAYGIDTDARRPALAATRLPAPPLRYSRHKGNLGNQALRYGEILDRQPCVFSAPYLEDVAAPADFDDSSMALPNRFTFALRNKRWNSFLLPRHYFELIHMDIKPAVLESFFAVGQPLLQFKRGATVVEDGQVERFFAGMMPDQARRFLQANVLIQSPPSAASLPAGQPAPTSASAGEEPGFRYTVTDYNANKLDLNVTADREGLLYWSNGYDPYWHAYVDGKEVPIYRANVDFKAIRLPAGTSQARFLYEPRAFQIALWMFWGVSAGALIVALITWALNTLCDRSRVAGARSLPLLIRKALWGILREAA